MNSKARDAFANITRKPGLQIWTINKMRMATVPTKAFGKFFEGDCYIILNIKKNKGVGESIDIHYWIGKSSSLDEQGSAALYVTQLDEYLGGSAVQYREVQGFESAKFRSYFKNGLIYKKGGVSSGFNHVETNIYNIKRLLHVKGRKHVSATEVELSWKSFNNGDVFILDLGKNIVQWNGPECNRREKLKAVQLAQDIRDRERGGRADIVIVEGAREKETPEAVQMMADVLGQKPAQLRKAIPDNKDEQEQNNNVRLYHVCDNSGDVVIQEVALQPLTQDLLRSSDCYILDNRGSNVMVWKGKKASKEERREAMKRALEYIKTKNYPSSTTVEVMSEGGESAMFKHLFKNWKEKGQITGLGKTYSVGKIAKVEQVKFNVMELHAYPDMAAKQHLVDDGSGEVKVWRIESLELAEVPPNMHGQFYGGDCYLVLYTYRMSNRDQYILYMWQGRHATRDEITACAYQAVTVDNMYNGAPVQVRVVMGKEPRHFLAIFKGKLIIFEGGTGRAGAVIPKTTSNLFQVRGTSELNTKAIEVPARASCLNSNDVFLLKTSQKCYLWYGKGCSGDERMMATEMSDRLFRQYKEVVMEGQEPNEFWAALGGKAPYASDKRLEREDPIHAPRLFECSNQTGRFRLTEVYDFEQSDLDEEDVMLLDTWEEIFLWVGQFANETETKEAWNSAHEYLKTHPAGRDPDTPIMFVKQGYEPLTFTGWFSAWDPFKWNEISAGNLMKGLDVTDNGGYSAPGGPTSPFPMYRTHGGVVSPTSPKSPFPTSHLKVSYSSAGGSGIIVDPKHLINVPVDNLPEGVDPSHRENYISEMDFESLLGVSRSEFAAMSEWRKVDLKKKAGLF
ncbi:villin-1 isoform X1 [Cyprinodon tularosa]|uniref:villin-1 isoform X1 n=1 Tax=Cyprinodon tularosa TaxID=77115 RepID=UPI0018E28797|nr:villin-1 isoform X1 [Cyprinodon tularosa]XP_038149536.1 villin-1 isoform X1 [Cyprinodon tularosa]